MDQKTDNNIPADFHAVEFMRMVRADFSELYHRDRNKYLDTIKDAMLKFRQRKSTQPDNKGLVQSGLTK